jgi:hypothetical protein
MSSDTIKPIVEIKNLAQKAILLSISIGVFSVNKKDKQKSAEVAKDENSSADYSRVVKSLLRNKGTTEVISYAAKARLDFKKKTSPWGDKDGWRVVKISSYQKIKSEVESYKREFERLRDLAVSEYQEIVDNDFIFERSPKGLGNLFKKTDYPSVSKFKESFYFDITVQAIESTDFRSGALSNEEIAEINSSIEARVNDSLKSAEFDILERIREKLNHLSSRLADFDTKFHTSNVTNLCEVLKEVRELNINDNRKIVGVIDSIEKNICGLSGESIRDNRSARTEAMIKTTQSIKEISTAMADFSF